MFYTTLGRMVIFGRDERAKVGSIQGELSESVRRAYDDAQFYRDGKWVMLGPMDGASIFYLMTSDPRRLHSNMSRFRRR